MNFADCVWYSVLLTKNSFLLNLNVLSMGLSTFIIPKIKLKNVKYNSTLHICPIFLVGSSTRAIGGYSACWRCAACTYWLDIKHCWMCWYVGSLFQVFSFSLFVYLLFFCLFFCLVFFLSVYLFNIFISYIIHIIL